MFPLIHFPFLDGDGSLTPTYGVHIIIRPIYPCLLCRFWISTNIIYHELLLNY